MKNVTARKDNIYTDPPGKIKSNFIHQNGDEEAYGFFYLTDHKIARVYISPEAAGFPATRCPSEGLVNPDGSCGDQLCCNCLTEDNSTTRKPDYWIY